MDDKHVRFRMFDLILSRRPDCPRNPRSKESTQTHTPLESGDNRGPVGDTFVARNSHFRLDARSECEIPYGVYNSIQPAHARSGPRATVSTEIGGLSSGAAQRSPTAGEGSINARKPA